MTEPPDSSQPESSSEEPGWSDTIREFIAARRELVRLEARDAGQKAARKLALTVVLLGGTVLTWLLLLAGLTGWLASMENGWPWYGIVFCLAGAHLLAAVLAAVRLKKPSESSFPLTRAELTKDQAWLESLKK